MDIAETIKRVSFTTFERVGEGNTAKIYKVPETDLVLKIFSSWPSTEFGLRGKSKNGLAELYGALIAARAPLLPRTNILLLNENPAYVEGMYPYGVIMKYEPNLVMGLGRFWQDTSVLGEYIALLGRLHAHGIVISPLELELGRQNKHQARIHIPAVVDAKLTLVDWTNFSLVKQIISFRNLSDTEFSSQLLLGRDIEHAYSFRPLFEDYSSRCFQERKVSSLSEGREHAMKLYLDSLHENSSDKDFVNRYKREMGL